MRPSTTTRPSGFVFATRRRLVNTLSVLLLLLVATPATAATTRLLVRTQGGLPVLQALCSLLGWNVQYGLGDPLDQLFLVTAPSLLPIRLYLAIPGILNIEIDQNVRHHEATQSGGIPPALLDKTPVNYYGTTVHRGYVQQPAANIIGLANAQSGFHVKGTGTIAVIDTGVDAQHPALQGVLLPGYDFTRNQAGAEEKGDIDQSTAAVIDQSTAAVIDQSTAAVIDQYTASTLSQPQYAGFGHGTMVAGLIHLVAPGAMILPLKAFHPDGTAYASDVIRAINFAVRNNADVLNMSFSFDAPSAELNTAIKNANRQGVICVAAAGNDGRQTTVYPAGYSNLVMGVASTSNDDTLSTFSNYGSGLVWVGAPGEGVVTLYPFGTYAAVWGTSFSTPIVAGTAALLLDVAGANQSHGAWAIAHAKYINKALGNGRLDVYQAVQSWLFGWWLP